MDGLTSPELLHSLTEDDKRELLEEMLKYIESAIQLKARSASFPAESARSEAVRNVIDDIVAKTGQDSEEAMLYAITLYRFAVDAAQEGQRLVLLDKEYRFIREIVGIGVKGPDVAAMAGVAG